MPVIASLICGFIFGSGLVISGMVQTAKVLGFLDLLAIPSGNWDPSLVVVMAAGLAVTGIGYAVIRPRAPIFTAQSHWPLGREIDRPLLTGAALFGIGWGLVGLCPGPAIADLATGSPGVVVFVVAMAVGMAVNDVWRLRGRANRCGRIGRRWLRAGSGLVGRALKRRTVLQTEPAENERGRTKAGE